MLKNEAVEAAGILQCSLAVLVAAVPAQGRSGSDLRLACFALQANAERLIGADAAGPYLANCFDRARAAGVTQPQLARVRVSTGAEPTTMSGATRIKWSIIGMCLAAEGRVISTMTFTSREDADALKLQMNAVFAQVEEAVADAMDQMTFQAMVSLHASIMFYLVETARPLPRLLQFAFAAPMPSLVMAYRLYADASRADELREENKVVHPAFEMPKGLALSA
jgi:prophage DNA circulation protein